MNHDVREFLERLERIDRYTPLSEAKAMSLNDARHGVTIRDGEDIVAVGAVASHRQHDGSTHVAVEAAVEPSLRFEEFEKTVLAATLDLVTDADTVSVWSRRPSLDRALAADGWRLERTLRELAVDLPIEAEGAPVGVRPFAPGDEALLIRINADAFGEHREAGSLDRTELGELMQAEWFDPSGILFGEVDGEVAAFCWTKVHPNGEGEIYRIGVGAAYRGRGLGKSMVIAGYRDLAVRRGCSTGFLWVDGANEAAMRMYAALGMTERTVNREFVKD